MLKASDREKLQDCLMLLQSANSILAGVGEEVVPGLENIQKCFLDVDRTITRLLRA